MNMTFQIRRLLIVFTVTMAMQSSFATAADKVTYLPIIGGGAIHYEIGDVGPGGGIVFWVSSDGQHGLEALQSDLASFGVTWLNGYYIETNASRAGINAGQFNTERIINHQGAGYYAAHWCANVTIGDYGDWYLPSREELRLMCDQQSILDDFTAFRYWSSTEIDAYNAWTISPIFSCNWNGYNKYGEYHVRCIRSF
jgi:hypothetical protein